MEPLRPALDSPPFSREVACQKTTPVPGHPNAMHMQRSTVHHLAEGSLLLRSTRCEHTDFTGPSQPHNPWDKSGSRNRAVCCIKLDPWVGGLECVCLRHFALWMRLHQIHAGPQFALTSPSSLKSGTIATACHRFVPAGPPSLLLRMEQLSMRMHCS